MRAGEPGCWTCAQAVEPGGNAFRHPAPDLRPKAPMVIGAPRQPPFARSRAGRPSTKTLFEIHTGCCRVRRKRKRLTSDGSIESDAAISRYPDPRRISPRHFR